MDELQATLQGAIDYFRRTEKFHNEVAQLSRLIFMNCKQFRMMKGLQEMKKIHQSLLRYLNMDIASLIEMFKGFIDDSEIQTVIVPYRQNLDFILVKLQGLSKLLIRTVFCSKRSASYFLGLIKAGSFYAKGVVFLSTIASIWSRSREFCKSVVGIYNKLHEFREQLTYKKGLEWGSSDYTLPTELESWLGDDWTNLIVNETYDKRLLLTEADFQDYLQINNQLLKRMEDDSFRFNAEQVVAPQTSNDSLELEDDTPIARTVIENEPINNEETHSFTNLTSRKTIQKFIKDETNYRKIDKLKSLTITKMKKKAWKAFKDDIKTKAILMQEGAFINYVNDYLKEI